MPLTLGVIKIKLGNTICNSSKNQENMDLTVTIYYKSLCAFKDIKYLESLFTPFKHSGILSLNHQILEILQKAWV